MMLSLFDRHRRLREQLSAYVDGELDASATARLERHLAECEDCRVELDHLRAAVAALRGLPAVEAPRSFTLRPEQVDERRGEAGPAPGLALGARIAAAGVAAALAVVLVVDAGDFGGGGVSERDIVPVSERGAEEPSGAPASDDGAGATGDAARPETTGSGESFEDAEGTPPAPAAGGPAEPSTEGDGGINVLTGAEIGLAAALAVLVAVSVALTVRARRP